MEAFAVTLEAGSDWRHLGHTPEKEAVEVILRSFDRPVLFATGATAARPDSEPVEVPPLSGRRLKGLHFFAKPALPDGACRVLVRGI